MVDKKTTEFEKFIVTSIEHMADEEYVKVTSYSQQDSAPNHYGFTAFFDGGVYEVVITRVKTKQVL
jgi:hypothetical protein